MRSSRSKDKKEQALVDDIQRVADLYPDAFPESKARISRTFYLSNGRFTSKDYTDMFGTFTEFRKRAFPGKRFKLAEEDVITRSDLELKVSHLTRKDTRGYLATTIIPDAPFNQPLFRSMLNYCKVKGYQLVLLATRGIFYKNAGYHEDVLDYMPQIATDFRFNSNLRAQDFLINPQMILPLTG